LETAAGGAHAHRGGGAAAASSAGAAPALEVHVVARQWWWDVVYPDAGVTTANEAHVPAGVPVRLTVTSADVIHSFWVPQAAGKVDAIPGKTSAITFRVDEPGVFRGLCSEFCGLQHAHMHFHLVVDSPGAFGAWLAAQQRVPPAPAPEESIVAQGQGVFLRSSCAQCHTVRGTAAGGTRGPDLTHVASRRTLGAGTHANSPANLARWATDPQAMKPGNRMPPTDLSDAEARAVVAYLESLE
jgi:cytochrome c oxidase subunit II